MIIANTRISQAISCRPGTYQTASMPIMEISQRKKSDMCKQKNPLSILCLLQIYYFLQEFTIHMIKHGMLISLNIYSIFLLFADLYIIFRL